MRTVQLTAMALLLGACAELSTTKEGAERAIDASVQALGGERFAVELTALNLDGYEVARCLAAGYADAQRDDDGNRQYPVYLRDGGKITDEFRRQDGIRTQTSKGVQTYVLTTEVDPLDHDGRDTMAVGQQLASCEQAGLPITIEQES